MSKINNTSIFYFSGTGNTEFIVKLMQKELREQGIDVNLFRIEDYTKSKVVPDLSSADLIGIATPVYGFDSPDIVREFVKILPKRESKIRTFVFKTGADYGFLNSSTAKREISKLKQKGYNVLYERIFAMPSNWAVYYGNTLTRELCKTNEEKVKRSCNEILEGKTREIKNPIILRWLAQIINFGEECFGARTFGLLLKSNHKCTQCAKCAKECPTENIKMVKKGVSFSWKCTWCMKCIYSCPANAIEQRLLKFCVHQNGYNLKKILNSSEENPSKISKNYQKYIDNLDL